MAPELSDKLWLYVLSYLPEHHKRNLISLNRTLYRIILEDISRELRIVAQADFVLRSRLKTPHLLHDVRHIIIRSAFEDPGSRHIITGIENRLWDFFSGDIFSVAEPVLTSCHQAERLSITVNKDPLPSSFGPFLKTLWRSIGPQLQKLAIKLAYHKLDLFFSAEIACLLPNVTNLDVHVLYHPHSIKSARNLISDTLIPFARVTSRQLLALSITWAPFQVAELALLFEKTKFPNLRTFSLTNAFGPDGSICLPLLNFLHAHRAKLQELTIRRSGDALPTFRNWFLSYFPSPDYSFPSLRLLAIDAFPSDFITEASHDLRLFDVTAPKLDSLLVSDITVDTYYLPLLNDATCPTLQLTRIHLTPKFLSTHILDILMNMPKLEELDLIYWDYGPYTDISSSSLDEFCQEMKTRSYTQTTLRHLRLAIRGRSCGRGHPDFRAMLTLSKCLTCPTHLELSSYCPVCGVRDGPKLHRDPFCSRPLWPKIAIKPVSTIPG